MSKTVEVPVDLLRESVQIGEEAAALCEKVAADQTELETNAPLIADVLIENGLVDQFDKAATVKLLRDPSASLDIVSRLAKQASQPVRMGASISSGPEAYDPQFPPQKESDRIFAEKLGAGGA